MVLTPPDASSAAGLRHDGAVRRRAVGRGLAAGLTAGLLAVSAGACSTGSGPSPSTGIDELVVPTPSPDPGDFVDGIDNPWFLLDDAAYADGAGRLVERTVDVGPEVAGVATTAATLDGVTDLFAQDERGNVWWFGRVGEWQAGTDGAQAGLAMAATPRLGDGYRRALVPGAEQRAEVVDVDRTSVVVETVAGPLTTRERYTVGFGLEGVETLDGQVVLVRQEEGE